MFRNEPDEATLLAQLPTNGGTPVNDAPEFEEAALTSAVTAGVEFALTPGTVSDVDGDEVKAMLRDESGEPSGVFTTQPTLRVRCGARPRFFLWIPAFAGMTVGAGMTTGGADRRTTGTRYNSLSARQSAVGEHLCRN